MTKNYHRFGALVDKARWLFEVKYKYLAIFEIQSRETRQVFERMISIKHMQVLNLTGPDSQRTVSCHADSVANDEWNSLGIW